MTNSNQMDLFPTQKKSTLLQEDTLANLSPSQVEKKVKKIQDISGQSILDLSKSCNQLGLLEKTLVDTLNSVSTPYSRTWRVKVTPQGRLVFQLRASVRTTKEKESGSWHTPTVMDHLPTRSEEALKKQYINHRKGRTEHSTLRDQVTFPKPAQMWPTPTAVQRPNEGNVRLLRKQVLKGNMTREEATKMLGKDVFEQQGKVPIWPTPTANEDAAGRPGGKMQKMLGNHPEVRKPLGGGTLNPTWVEWLMGYPLGFTDLNHLETVSSPKSPTTSDSVSSNRLMWPTPAARSFQPPRKPETMAKTGRNPLTNTLEDAVQHREIEKRKNWPTPTVGMVEGGEQSHRVEKTKGGAYILRKKNKPNSTFGAKLSDAILFEEKQKIWPTPRARDWKDGYGVPPSVEKGTRGHTLGTKVQEEENKMWPTPCPGSKGRGAYPHKGVVKSLLEGEKPSSQALLVDKVAVDAIKKGQGFLDPNDKMRVKLWPTPTATDGRRGEIHEDGTIKKSWKKRRDKWAAKGVNLHRPLDIVVALEEEKKQPTMWRTPTQQDSRIGPNNKGGYQHRKKRGSTALADQVMFENYEEKKIWRTPTAMDGGDTVSYTHLTLPTPPYV